MKSENTMEDNSRRSFFKKAAAAVGVVAAAGATKTLIAPSCTSSDEACAKYAADIATQEKAVTGNGLIVMTDDEKRQRLDQLLNCHYQEIA
ncbi:MAG: twin-arginine translocation signal domain-containing protein [Nitrosomonadales bacterium]|nr:twin-arginine translocation signal domain-containing protein [Nitrosomonadales bacterium]